MTFSPAYAGGIITQNPFSNEDPYGISPFLTWKTVESEHFRIIYPDALEPVAQRVANLYEEAHAQYVPLFHWEPRYKAQVILLDNQDQANGITSPLGRFGMILWVTPPDSWMSTNYYDDWLRFLIFHEYTHFMNMDTTDGFYSAIRPVFLDLFLPNSTWTPWMLEGLAVYMETHFTTAGRGRSPYYEMVLRAAVEEKVLNQSAFMTLDKVTGANPYYPVQDTRYQFGYALMNQVAQSGSAFSADGRKGTELLGQLSYRSASSVPFFINTDLKGLTGKDWSDYWSDWVNQTEQRMSQDLKKLKAQPRTIFHLLTQKGRENSNEVSGIAASRDGQWLAYTLVSANRRSGLYLMNLKTHESKRLSDKLLGVGLQFTPDSKSIVYSEYNTLDQYVGFSDLKVYSLENQRHDFLTHRLRARDPDVSPDGQWIVFTVVETARVSLARASLTRDARGRSQLGPVEILVSTQLYERISSPRFSHDGRKVYYTFHPHAKSQEDLVELDLERRRINSLVADGHYNRFPAIDPSGELYYVSNATGVDNLYHYSRAHSRPELWTHVTTGLSFPCFGADPKSRHLYVSLFSATGADLAEVDLGAPLEIDPTAITVSPPPAPQLSEESYPKTQEVQYPSRSYSVYPSLLPRGVIPIGSIEGSGMSVGAETLGFDALNAHRYILAAAYSTRLGVLDAYGLYSNRTLGPDFSFSAGYLTTLTQSSSSETDYYRKLLFSSAVGFPIIHTYDQWRPSIGLNLERMFLYQYQSGVGTSAQGASLVSPSLDTSLTYSNEEVSSLAITSEAGRFSQIAVRNYLLPGAGSSVKVLAQDREFIRLTDHTILYPSLSMSWASSPNLLYPLANVVVQGRNAQAIVNSAGGDGLDQVSVRGYPGQVVLATQAVKPALDLRVPISRIFRGHGTNRIFLDNFYGLAFAETSWVSGPAGGVVLPSAGLGLRLSTEFFYLPVTLSTEYHYGFNLLTGGGSDLFFQFLVSGMSF